MTSENINSFSGGLKSFPPAYSGSISKRMFDIIFSSAFLLLLSPIFFGLCIVSFVRLGRPIFFKSKRVGQCNKFFYMNKFRTMPLDTPIVASHLLMPAEISISPFGSFLRKSSLDELPQLLSILNGDMSVVGPRPSLYNQLDLIELRTTHNVHLLKPGLTGWAQINGRDNLTIKSKVEWDIEYFNEMSFLFDIRVIFLTAKKVLLQNDVSH